MEHAINIAELARPLVETIQRKGRDLASQLRRAISGCYYAPSGNSIERLRQIDRAS